MKRLVEWNCIVYGAGQAEANFEIIFLFGVIIDLIVGMIIQE